MYPRCQQRGAAAWFANRPLVRARSLWVFLKSIFAIHGPNCGEHRIPARSNQRRRLIICCAKPLMGVDFGFHPSVLGLRCVSDAQNGLITCVRFVVEGRVCCRIGSYLLFWVTSFRAFWCIEISTFLHNYVSGFPLPWLPILPVYRG